ncbi:hypothetical protein [Teredinibacter waterburyi]|uniref:hypothetical protein n=1 Tax=Teredinibacter waterburyi TaxID=1500538 RepID=UPI00165F375C|nr:hypothetical protein [Teredinibacter waterburyi]
MKISVAIKKGKTKNWLYGHIRRNPSSPKQWFVMLTDKKLRPFMLVNDDDNPILSEDLNEFIEIMKKIGLREFSVFL